MVGAKTVVLWAVLLYDDSKELTALHVVLLLHHQGNHLLFLLMGIIGLESTVRAFLVRQAYAV